MIKKILFFLLNVLFVVKISFASGAQPQISNFRIESNQPDKIYFDSNVLLIGSDASGFDLKDHDGISITGVFINSGQLIGHYFSVSSNFSWYHNNTLNYNGGSDMQSIDGVTLPNFTLQFIDNNISIPDVSGTEYYVSLEGSDSNNGLSESNAFRTIQKGVDQLRAGDKLWIKAGNYGSENIAINNSGTNNNPIRIEGYKIEIGDIKSPYYDYGNPNGNIEGSNEFLADEMPLLDANNQFGGGSAIRINYTHSFIIIKNIQAKNYRKGYELGNQSSQIIFENVMGKNMGTANTWGSIFYANSYLSANNYLRFKNCTAINGSEDNFVIDGHNSLIENCRAYGDRGNTYGSIGIPTDYYYLIKGKNSIVRNSKATRVSIGHGVHAFSLKYYAENILVENCETINTQWSYQARYRAVHHNVFRNCEARANVPFRFINGSTSETGGIHVLNGAHHNVFENMYIHDTDIAFLFDRANEDGPDMGNDNIFKNSIIDNIRLSGIEVIAWEYGTPSFNNNKFYNISFNNIQGSLFYLKEKKGSISMKDNEFKNCIFKNVNELFKTGYQLRPLGNSEFDWDTNNFYNSFSAQGSNGINVDPKFQNPSLGDFSLLSDSECIDAGLVLEEVTTDFDNKPRKNQGSSFDIGAYEYQNEVIGDVYAGEDVSICNGSNITLTATGSGDFLWDTGDTTQSITVSPTETTTYTVTLTNDGSSTSDSVEVVVKELPTANAGEDVSICGGETTLTASGGDSYLWSTGETTQSITVSPTETIIYTVTTSNEGCTETAEDQVEVIVNSVLNLEAGDDASICKGSSVTLTATGADNYEWSTGETTASITVNPETTTTYTVSTSNGDCSVSDNVEVVVNELPTANAGEDVSICGGETILTASGGDSYLWSTGETTQSITVSPTETTIYTVTTSNEGCSETAEDQVEVIVNSVLNLEAGDDASICKGSSVTLTATGADNYEWSTGETTASITVNPEETTTYTVSTSNGDCSISDSVEVIVSDVATVNAGDDVSICYGEDIVLIASGNGNFLWSTGETTKRITVSPETTTTYSVTTSSLCGEDVSDEVIVTVNNLPIANAGDDLTIMNGDSVTLTASGDGNYLWSTGETTQSITINPTETTIYAVTVTSNTGCASNDSVTITVEAPDVVANAGEDVEICKNTNVNLTASGGDTYLWSTGATTKNITVSPAQTTTYTVTVSNATSSDTDDVKVTVNNLPIVNAGEDVTIENGSNTTLTASGEGDYLWTTGETTRSITVSPTETTTYFVTLTSASGCSSEDSVQVIVEDTNTVQVVANAGEDVEICSDSKTILTANGGDSYLWSTGEVTQSITVSPDETTIYSVTVSNEFTLDTDEVTVSVDQSCSGIANRAINKKTSIYPNPTDGVLNIRLKGYSEDIRISIINVNGNVLLSQVISNYSSSKNLNRKFDLSRYGRGLYFVRIENKQVISTEKIILY